MERSRGRDADGGAGHIENCRVHDFNAAASGFGILLQPSLATELYVTNTTISHNGSASDGAGIQVQAPPGSTSKVVINQSNVQNGIVNLLNNKRDEAARSISSSGDGRLTPSLDRRRAERAVRGG